MRNTYRILAEESEGKQIGRPGRIWENNININLKETGYNDVEWINLA
jgi:hypothetical protein